MRPDAHDVGYPFLFAVDAGCVFAFAGCVLVESDDDAGGCVLFGDLVDVVAGFGFVFLAPCLGVSAVWEDAEVDAVG